MNYCHWSDGAAVITYRIDSAGESSGLADVWAAR
jgi:hypothetical protein